MPFNFFINVFEGHSISNQPTLLPIEMSRFLFVKLISSKLLFDLMFEKKLSNNLTKI